MPPLKNQRNLSQPLALHFAGSCIEKFNNAIVGVRIRTRYQQGWSCRQPLGRSHSANV